MTECDYNTKEYLSELIKLCIMFVLREIIC